MRLSGIATRVANNPSWASPMIAQFVTHVVLVLLTRPLLCEIRVVLGVNDPLCNYV